MSNKIIQHKRSSTAGNKPDNTQIEVGEIAINFADRAIFTKDGSNVVTQLGKEIWKDSAQPDSAREGDLWYNLDTKQIKYLKDSTWTPFSTDGAVVSAGNTTASGGFASGSGTEGDPYVITATSTGVGEKGVFLGTITISGLDSNQEVTFQDLNEGTNGTRFHANNGQYHALANGSGTLTANIVFSDIPTTTSATTYTGKLKIGSNSVYVETDVTVSIPLEGGSTVSNPNGTGVGSNTWQGSDGTALTSSGDLLLSTDGTNFSNSITVNNGDTYYVKWAGDPGSGTGIDQSHGTTITGTVSDDKGGSTTLTLTIDKETTFNFQTSVDSDQTRLAISTSTEITLSDINSYVYPYGTTDGDSAQYSKNNGTFLDTPSSNTGSSTHYAENGDKIKIQHRNRDSDNARSTYTFNMGGDSADFVTVTADVVPVVATPSITSPANDGETGISGSGPYTSSNFAMTQGTATHTASSWEIYGEGWSKRGATPNVEAADIVWNGSKYLLVGYGANTSTDGITWTDQPGLQSTVGNVTFHSAAWNGSIFCAVGGNGACGTSPDGVTWTNRPSLASVTGGSSDMNDIIWNADRSEFIAVGIDGKCATSSNGTTWTNRTGLATATGSETAQAVTWDGSQYVCVGNQAKCATSPDGITWTNRPDFTSKLSAGVPAYDIIYNNGLLVACGNNGRVLTSSDGISWTLQSSSTVLSGKSMRCIVWDGTQYIVAGQSAMVGTSFDAVTWTAHTEPSGYIGNVFVKGIETNGSGQTVMAGASYNVGPAVTLDRTLSQNLDSDTSALESWTPSPALGGPIDFKLRVRHHTASQTSQWSGYRSFTSESTLGKTWTTSGSSSSASAAGNNTLHSAAWDGSRWLVGGDNGTLITSSDGLSWTASTGFKDAFDTVVQSYKHCYEVRYFSSSGVYIATFQDGRLLTSTDGDTWTYNYEAASGNEMYSVAYSGSRYVTVGQSMNTYYSDNVTNWTSNTSGISSVIGSATGGAREILWNPDRNEFIAVGAQTGQVMAVVSSDGANFTNSSISSNIGGSSLLMGVRWNGSVYCTVGQDAKCATSSDGLTWTNQTGLAAVYGTSWAFAGLSWDGNNFITAGTDGKAATSPDGVTWTLHSIGSASSAWRDLHYNGNQVLAVGNSGETALSP